MRQRYRDLIEAAQNRNKQRLQRSQIFVTQKLDIVEDEHYEKEHISVRR